MFLSQPPTTSTPSMHWPLTDGLDRVGDHFARHERILHALGAHADAVGDRRHAEHLRHRAALRSAAIARSTSGWMPALHGFIVLWPLATPTIGFSKSSSPKPTARSIARLGERATPCGDQAGTAVGRHGEFSTVATATRLDDTGRHFRADVLYRSMLVHPQFDPVAFQVGPIAVRWYGPHVPRGFVLFVVLGRVGAAQLLTGWRAPTSTTCCSSACSA
jgi:hypothetical protein